MTEVDYTYVFEDVGEHLVTPQDSVEEGLTHRTQ